MSGRYPTQLSELAQWLPQSAIGGDCAFQGVSIDTRQLAPGNLFIALQGARDGHDFIQAAADAGASRALPAEALLRASFPRPPRLECVSSDRGIPSSMSTG